MHIKNVWRYRGIVEVERIHSGRYGKKGTPGPRKLPTPEEMKAVNERNCIKKLRRKIQANFGEGDLFLTLTYKKETRPDAREARRRLKNYLERLRRRWKKAGVPLKYIIVTEYENKSIHHHLVLNDILDGSGAKEANRCWKENGGTHTEYLYEDGHYENLAAYLVKETSKTFRKPGSPSKTRYSCSRNLVDPKPKTVILKSDRWPEDPRVPKGYYLDKQSLVNGVNKMGYRYQYYRLVSLSPKKHIHGKSKAGKDPGGRKQKGKMKRGAVKPKLRRRKKKQGSDAEW